MPKKSSIKKDALEKNTENAEAVKQTEENNSELSSQSEQALSPEDCVDDIEKGKTVVEKMKSAATDEGRAANRNTNCKCMPRKGKFYAYRLVQGRWTQASGISYPTKEMCEENNCN